jgi:protein tyrosine phosphatase (PTP) superfamily phosphohydrolase (DUF442 family)
MSINHVRKFFLAVVILQIALLSAGAAAQTATRPSTPPPQPISIENFGKVNDNYYRGSQPDAAQFRDLKRLGVKTVIDLREDKLAEASDWAKAAGLQYINIPLTTKRAATEDQSSYFLKLVNDPANWPIYVHCKGGRHRTGEMTALYRITRDGWTAVQAYEEMKQYDFEDSFFYPRTLKKYVFSYYERFNSSKNTSVSAP